MGDEVKHSLIWATAAVLAVGSLSFGCGGCCEKQSANRKEVFKEVVATGKTTPEIEVIMRAYDRGGL